MDADEDVAMPPKLPLNIIIFLLCDVSDRTEGLSLCQRHLNLDYTHTHIHSILFVPFWPEDTLADKKSHFYDVSIPF